MVWHNSIPPLASRTPKKIACLEGFKSEADCAERILVKGYTGEAEVEFGKLLQLGKLPKNTSDRFKIK